MKKLLLVGLAVVAVGAAGGGGYMLLRPHDRLEQARALIARGELRGASLTLRQVLLDDPGNAEAHYRLALLDLRARDPVAAETELAAARDHGWSPLLLRAPFAQALVAQGRFEDALQQSGTDDLPPDQAVAVLAARGAALLGLGRIGEARTDAARASTLDPQSAPAALLAGQAAQASGDPKAAERAVTLALALDPKSAPALLFNAELHRQTHDSAGAIAALDAAIAIAPTWAVARQERAELLVAAHQDDKAHADLQVVLQQQPHAPGAGFLLADILARAGKWTEADGALRMIGPALSTIPRGQYLAALVLAHLGEPEQALDAATHYLAHAPTDANAYRLVAQLYLQAHSPREAADILQRAVAGGHADADLLALLATAQSQAGQPAQAVVSMQGAVAMHPDDFATRAQLGMLRLAAGDAPGAADDLARALASPKAPSTGALKADSSPADKNSALTDKPGSARASTPEMEATAALAAAALQAGELDRAAAALAKFRALGGDPARAALLQGALDLARLDAPGARAALEEARRLAPDALGPSLQLAHVMVLLGQAAQAEKLLADAVASHPDDHGALAAYVAVLVSDGDTARATDTLKAAHAARPLDDTVAIGLTDMLVRSGQPAQALSVLDDLDWAGARPASDRARTDLLAARSRALVALGRFDEAVPLVRQMVAAMPDDATLRTRFARLMLAAGDVPGAQSAIQDGLSRKPNDPTLLNVAVAIAARVGGADAGLDLAEKLAADPATGAAAGLLKGNLLLSQKRYHEAASAFAAHVAPDAPPIFAIREAEALAAGGRSAEAERVLQERLASHPDTPDASMLLASLELADQDFESARGHYRDVLDRQPNNPAALNNIAWLEQRRGNLPAARALAQRAWLLAPSPQSSDTLGWILQQSGDTARALELLRLAAQGKSADPAARYHYAVALKQSGRRDEAKAILASLIASPADFDGEPDARRTLKTLSQP